VLREADLMKERVALAALLTLVMAGCATTMPASGEPASLASPSTVADTAAFDHGCPLERVRMLRADAKYVNVTSTVDLDVCGAVRRYKGFRGFEGNTSTTSQTWVDVTSLYPPSTLPAPIPSAHK
jgi:hypothetical protein